MKIPKFQGVVDNFCAAASDPRSWWLARQSVVKYGAIQHIDELTRFVRLAGTPRTVLEIGTAQGGLFWLFCQISEPDATLLSLDLPPEGRYSGGQSTAIDLQSRKKSGQTVHVIHGNSHDQTTLKRVRSLLGSQALDLLFIDGDHTYDGVGKDYEMYGPLVRRGGLIGLHDIRHTPWPGCQVDDFWANLLKDKSLKTSSILGRTHSEYGGIGIVEVG